MPCILGTQVHGIACHYHHQVLLTSLRPPLGWFLTGACQRIHQSPLGSLSLTTIHYLPLLHIHYNLRTSILSFIIVPHPLLRLQLMCPRNCIPISNIPTLQNKLSRFLQTSRRSMLIYHQDQCPYRHLRYHQHARHPLKCVRDTLQ